MLHFLARAARRPSHAEERVFESFAAEARSVGTRLARDARFVASSGSMLDLHDAREAEFALLAAETMAKEHLARREHLLVLVERVSAMIDASPRRIQPQGKLDAGLHLLRAFAMAEVLVAEATTRFRNHPETGARATTAMSCLATGTVARLGTRLPPNLVASFPRFAKAVHRAAHPARLATARDPGSGRLLLMGGAGILPRN
jgi:hypothetical protein